MRIRFLGNAFLQLKKKRTGGADGGIDTVDHQRGGFCWARWLLAGPAGCTTNCTVNTWWFFIKKKVDPQSAPDFGAQLGGPCDL